MLSLNHLGLVEKRAGEGARAVKDILSLFADLTDGITERRIRGVRSVSSKPVNRRVRVQNSMATARGLEITVTIEDNAFEGSGVYLLGAVLDRFFAEYVSINHFTETVIRTPERQEIMRWPARVGTRHNTCELAPGTGGKAMVPQFPLGPDAARSDRGRQAKAWRQYDAQGRVSRSRSGSAFRFSRLECRDVHAADGKPESPPAG